MNQNVRTTTTIHLQHTVQTRAHVHAPVTDGQGEGLGQRREQLKVRQRHLQQLHRLTQLDDEPANKPHSTLHRVTSHPHCLTQLSTTNPNTPAAQRDVSATHNSSNNLYFWLSKCTMILVHQHANFQYVAAHVMTTIKKYARKCMYSRPLKCTHHSRTS